MTSPPLQKRCEICLNFDPDNTQRRVLKSLTARNPTNQTYYERIAGLVAGGTSVSSDMGTCYLSKERVKEDDVCAEFLNDISRQP